MFAAVCAQIAAVSVSSTVTAERNANSAISPRLPATMIPIAVLGDSDSHSYHDTISFPASSSKRGGSFRANTWQWTEILARLRANEVDMGEWSAWGTSPRIAKILGFVGLSGRTPRKEDYRFNFAISGATCQDLIVGTVAQTPQLITQMSKDPLRWQQGVVVIRIGVNTVGQNNALDRYAREGASAAVRRDLLSCVDFIQQAVGQIHQHHPKTRVVLVGIFDNANLPENNEKWMSQRERQNISSALDIFDDALKDFIQRDARLSFFDDRAFFRKFWGSVDFPNGVARPHFKAVNFGGLRSVENTKGDEPTNAGLADGHAGVVWNALWAQELVALLKISFGLNLTNISNNEIAQFVDPKGTIGLYKLPR
jgi:hypothetical protein